MAVLTNLLQRLSVKQSLSSFKVVFEILKQKQNQETEEAIKGKLIGARLVVRALKRRLVFNKLTFLSSGFKLTSDDKSRRKQCERIQEDDQEKTAKFIE